MTTSMTDEGALREALAFEVMAMVLADGRVEPAELEHARGALARCHLFAGSATHETQRLLDLVERQARDAPGASASRHAATLRASPWRFSAVAIMAEVMAADGRIDRDEVDLIQRHAALLGVSERSVMAVIHHTGTDAIEDLITGRNLDAIKGLKAMD